MNTENANNIAQQLAAPFPLSEIKFRVGATTKDKAKGQALAYIDSRSVSDRLDHVVGADNWESKLEPVIENGAIIGFLCTLTIWFGDKKVSRVDFGGASSADAVKGAASDALKRAAVHFGIGRYLYSLTAPWVPLNQYKQIQNPPTLPAWALPANGPAATPALAQQQAPVQPQQAPYGAAQPALGGFNNPEVTFQH